MKEQKPACVAHGDKYRNDAGYCGMCLHSFYATGMTYEEAQQRKPMQTVRPPVRRGDPDTSRNAAPDPERMNERQKVVFAAIKAMGGAAANEQIIDYLGEEQVGNISSRVSELQDMGLLVFRGNYHTSRQGKPQRIREVA